MDSFCRKWVRGKRLRTVVGLSGKGELCKVLGTHTAGRMHLDQPTVARKATTSGRGSHDIKQFQACSKEAEVPVLQRGRTAVDSD